MNDAKDHIHKWGNNMTRTVGFLPQYRCKWELPDQNIPKSILPHELFFNILITSTVCSHDMSKVTKLLDEAKFLISEPDSCWVPTLWLLWSDQHTYCFRCVVYNVMRSSICGTYCTSNSVWRAVTVGASNTISSA